MSIDDYTEEYYARTYEKAIRLAKRGIEIWRPILGWEGIYKVSNLGKVKSLKRIVPMSDGRQYRVSEKILKPAFDGHYYHVTLCRPGGGEKLELVHKLVLEAFVGPRPIGMEGCHNPDRNTSNNRIDNLRWDTVIANKEDQKRHGTTTKGKVLGKGHSHKLKGRVHEVYALREQGLSLSQIAEKLGVTWYTVSYHLSKNRGGRNGTRFPH